MSGMKPTIPKLDSVDSIYNYLKESSPPEVVSSTTPSSAKDSTRTNNQLKSTKKVKKEKDTTNQMNNIQINPTQLAEKLPSGRVKYGPITVNPRKQPSKTLFTGRRSKYEILTGEEEEKRRQRRERNRVAATKCRIKRDDILTDLEHAYDYATNQHTHLLQIIEQLNQRKLHLQSALCNYPPLQPSMVFGNPGFLSTMTETPAPRLPPHQLELIANNEEEFNRIIQPTNVLTNSAYNSDQINYLDNSQQTIPMSSGSIERFINDLQSTAPYTDNNNNNTSQELFNSACSSSTCARQHSHSSEDESMPSTHKNSNSYVF